MSDSPFTHRTYLGWITDLATTPDPHAAWPSMRRDAALLEDYEAALETIAELGFDTLCVWGLAASRDWPLDLGSALTPEKREFAAALSEKTRARGLKLTAGLGVFSWGFDEIIRCNPHLGPTNKSAMCAHETQSWDWMRRVIDCVFSELPIDGVQMQSADLGRCECPKCARWNSLEHHAHLNGENAKYIRAQWPGKSVAANGWGMSFKDEKVVCQALPMLCEMGAHLDYFTGIDDASASSSGVARQLLIDHLPCAVGTVGGAQVEPPQHWARDRYFLPLAKRTSDHIRELAEAGGLSCEAFFHIFANPGDELSLQVRGLALQSPFETGPHHLESALRKLYAPRDDATLARLCELFSRAEEAYFGRAQGAPCGTMSLEPLTSSEVGPPIYLDRLSEDDRAAYGSNLKKLRPQFLKLREAVGAPHKIDAIARCLENAERDAAKS